MNTTKITREEVLRRWNASKETKRKMVEKLETLVRNSCLERTGKEPIGIEVWQSKHCLQTRLMSILCKLAANLANFAETKSRYGEGTELVRSGLSDDILWGGLQNLKQYMMEKVIVDVAWCDRNYGGSLGSNVPRAVVLTAPTLEALQKEAKESLEFHVGGLMENGEDVPEWLKNGDYEFVYNIIR